MHQQINSTQITHFFPNYIYLKNFRCLEKKENYIYKLLTDDLMNSCSFTKMIYSQTIQCLFERFILTTY